MTDKSEDPELAKVRRALDNILKAIKPLKVAQAQGAPTFMLAQLIVFAADANSHKPDMKERLNRLAATNHDLGAMVEDLLRKFADADSPPDLLRSFLEQRRRKP
jgi:hypothetical protein